MRIVSVLLFVCAVTMLGGEPAKQTPARKAAAPAARKTTGDIPADAKKVDEYTYEHTDANGKTWYYRRTPFGVMRSEKREPDASSEAEIERNRVSPFAGKQATAPAETVTATETEDSVTFVRTTPFGRQSWTRRKAEMTDADKALFERAKKEPAKGEK